MKNIYLIFIFTCLVEQLKADVYAVKVNDLYGISEQLVNTTWSQGATRTVSIHEDIKQGEIWAEMVFIDPEHDSYEAAELPYELRDFCNMDTSTKNGTIAAILWGVLGIESCPVAAGTYRIIREFNKTGIIEDMFEVVDKTMTITANFVSSNDKAYFQVATEVRLVEKEPQSPDDDEGEAS